MSDFRLGSREILVEQLVRLVYRPLLLAALVVWFRGHNAPGGGFIAGLLAVAATASYALVFGGRSLPAWGLYKFASDSVDAFRLAGGPQAVLAPLPAHWRLPGITLLLAGCALMTLQLGGSGSIRWPSGASTPCSGWRSSGRHGPEPGLLPVPAAEFAMTADARQELEYSLRPRFAHCRGASR